MSVYQVTWYNPESLTKRDLLSSERAVAKSNKYPEKLFVAEYFTGNAEAFTGY